MGGHPVLVTGAARGIGRAVADVLLEQGFAIIESDIEAGPAARIGANLAEAHDLERLAAEVRARAGDGLGGIVHVAGLPGTHPPERILAVNLHAPVRLTGALEDLLCPGAGIVAVASITAHRCTWPDDRLEQLIDQPHAPPAAAADLEGVAAYEVSKKALILWTQRLAARLHARGIRANSVSPGPVETPILADFARSMGADRLEAARRMVGRHATPQDIAPVVAFLLSPGAGWISGVDIKVDGGFHALRAAAAGRAVA